VKLSLVPIAPIGRHLAAKGTRITQEIRIILPKIKRQHGYDCFTNKAFFGINGKKLQR
jgi:hypothetical protein